MSNVLHLTGIMKIHNPSRWRRKILDRVLVEYSLSMDDMLKWSENNIDYIKTNGQNKRGKYTSDYIKPLLPRPVDAAMSSALKDGLVDNVASMLASYLEKGNRDNVGFPVSCNPQPAAYDNALDDLVNIYLENTVSAPKDEALAMERQAADRFKARAKSPVMPLNFCRSRDFAILVDAKKRRFFVWLKLSEPKTDGNLQQDIKGNNLVDISTGEFFSKRKGTGVLFPAEAVGGWMWDRFLRPVTEQWAAIKTAKLVKENDDYFLHVSFAFDCPEPYEPESYLGIDRGVFYTMAYAVVDSQGAIKVMDFTEDVFRDARILAGKKIQKKQRKGRPVTVKDYRGRYLENVLHILVNQVIDLALEHRSMIVLEQLNIQIKGKFYKSAWRKLHGILEYKCKLAGVPIKRGGVWAANTSQICIYCGGLNKGRKRGEPFDCPYCFAHYHSDAGAAVNIARRAMYRKSEWGGTKTKPGDWRAFHRSFANGDDLQTEIDLRELTGSRQLVLL